MFKKYKFKQDEETLSWSRFYQVSAFLFLNFFLFYWIASKMFNNLFQSLANLIN